MHALATTFAAGIRPGARRRQAPKPGDRTAYKEIGSRLHEYPARQSRTPIHDSQSDHPPRFQTNLREQSFSKRNSTAAAKRRAHRGMVTMGNAMRAAVSQQVGQTTSGTNLFSEPRIREELTALVCQYTPRQLSKFSGATPEGARHWLDGSRTANLTNTINMARSIPAIATWLADRSGYVRAIQAISADAVIQWAVEHRMAADHDGTLARAILREISEPQKKPPAESDWRPDNVVRDLFRKTA